MSKDNKAPAFPAFTFKPIAPYSGAPSMTVVEGGMTLRDYFAAKTLSCLDIQAHVEAPAAEILARSAYHIADAMLKARDE